MTRRKQLISLTDVLRSTQIEFLQFGTPLLQIAEALGPPKGWISDIYDGQPVPLYWVYPGGLELSFDPEPPYPLASFKLSDVGAHKGKLTKFGHHAQMRNDFRMIETKGFWVSEKCALGSRRRSRRYLHRYSFTSPRHLRPQSSDTVYYVMGERGSS